MNILKRNQRSSGFIRSVLLAVFFIIPSIACAQSFTPLTSLPGVADATSSPDLAAFLSNIYKLCIGAAAILAVLKIIQGGITYMLGDSITEKKEARHHIAMAVLGLVLVLSPALVFGIIDQRILSLDIGKSIEKLATEPGDGSGNQNGVPSPGADTGTDNGGGTPDTSNPDTSTDPDPDNAPVTPPKQPPSNMVSVTSAHVLPHSYYYTTAYIKTETYSSGWSCKRLWYEYYTGDEPSKSCQERLPILRAKGTVVSGCEQPTIDQKGKILKTVTLPSMELCGTPSKGSNVVQAYGEDYPY
jgi:hypothetical protein